MPDGSTSADNARLQPSQLRTYNPNNGSAGVLNLSYGFTASDDSNNGNLVSLVSSATQVFMRSYTYDELNRLSTMSSPADPSGCNGLTWTYDAWANRTNQTTSSGACTESHPTIGANNQFTGTPYTYDAAGNMTADGNHTYTYDAENRLTTVDGGATATYVYDAEGQRVLKTTGGVTTAYLYDPAGNVVAETNGGDTLNIGYAYAGSELVAEYEGGTTLFVHKNHLGSTRIMTAMNGTASDSMDYLPYGEQIAGGSGTTHKFTGKERDSESGLDNFEARYMGSNLGRFMSPDPSNIGAIMESPQTWNAYSYVANNPLNATDPDGLDCVYTSNQTSQGVEVSVASGSCQKGDGGTYVNGTVDQNSLTYDGSNLGYSYSNSADHTGGAGVIALGPAGDSGSGGDNASNLAAEMNKRPMMGMIGAFAGGSAAIGLTGGAACYYLCPSAAGLTTLGLTAGATAGPLVTNPRLQEIVNDLFQVTDKLPGGTAGAVRSELSTGNLLSPTGHTQKAIEAITRLNNLLKSGNLSYNDQIQARTMIQDLRNALGH